MGIDIQWAREIAEENAQVELKRAERKKRREQKYRKFIGEHPKSDPGLGCKPKEATPQNNDANINIEKKEISLGLVSSWFFGALFLMAGAGSITAGNIVAGMVLFLMSAILIPPSIKAIEQKTRFKFTAGLKAGILSCCFILFGIFSNNNGNETRVNSQHSKPDALDPVVTTTIQNNVQPAIIKEPVVPTKDWDIAEIKSNVKHGNVQMPDRVTCIRELKGSVKIIEMMSDVRRCLLKGDAGVCEKNNGEVIILKCTNDDVLNVIY